jgi:hypothetical protein
MPIQPKEAGFNYQYDYNGDEQTDENIREGSKSVPILYQNQGATKQTQKNIKNPQSKRISSIRESFQKKWCCPLVQQ